MACNRLADIEPPLGPFDWPSFSLWGNNGVELCSAFQGDWASKNARGQHVGVRRHADASDLKHLISRSNSAYSLPRGPRLISYRMRS